MGDLNAVDYSMGARVAVLRQDPDVLPDDQWARPGLTFPSGARVQVVVVGDRVGLCAQNARCRAADKAMARSFKRGRDLLEQAGLR
eukprot:868132-Alexandrium_andersonii.AAC.1